MLTAHKEPKEAERFGKGANDWQVPRASQIAYTERASSAEGENDHDIVDGSQDEGRSEEEREGVHRPYSAAIRRGASRAEHSAMVTLARAIGFVW